MYNEHLPNGNHHGLRKVYAVRCAGNGKLYIGYAHHVNAALQKITADIEEGICLLGNGRLQADINEYGLDSLECYVLDEQSEYPRNKKKNEYIELYNALDERYGYNAEKREPRENNLAKYFKEGKPPLPSKPELFPQSIKLDVLDALSEMQDAASCLFELYGDDEAERRCNKPALTPGCFEYGVDHMIQHLHGLITELRKTLADGAEPSSPTLTQEAE